MRSMKYVSLSLLLTVSFVAGAFDAQAQDGRQYFSNYMCTQPLACPSSSELTTSDYVAAATFCMADLYGIRSDKDLFEASYGLDMKGCLKSVPPSTGSKELKYECCIVPFKADEDNSPCVVRCGRFASN